MLIHCFYRIVFYLRFCGRFICYLYGYFIRNLSLESKVVHNAGIIFVAFTQQDIFIHIFVPAQFNHLRIHSASTLFPV